MNTSFAPTTLDFLVKEITALSQKTKDNVIITICGGSCTGKSTQIAAGLSQRLAGNALIFPQDGYQRNPDYIVHMDPIYRWDHPQNYGIESSKEVLKRLKRNQAAVVPNYQFQKDLSIEHITLTPKPIILFEGLYAAHGELAECADWILYVETPLYARLLRRIFRNTRERYRSKNPARIVEGFLGSVTQAHQDFVVAQKDWADAIIHMPFRFEELIQRLDLHPIDGSYSHNEQLFEFMLDPQTQIHLWKSEGQPLFTLHFEGRPYLAFPITFEAYKKLRRIDFQAV